MNLTGHLALRFGNSSISLGHESSSTMLRAQDVSEGRKTGRSFRQFDKSPSDAALDLTIEISYWTLEMHPSISNIGKDCTIMAQTTRIPIDRMRPSARTQPQNLLDSTPVLFRLPEVRMQPLPQVSEAPPAAFLKIVQETQPTLQDHEPEVAVQPTSNAEPKTLRSWWEHWSSGIVLIVLIIALITISIMVFGSSSKPLDGAYTKTESETDFGDLDQIAVPTIQIAETTVDSLGNTATAGQLVQAAEESGSTIASTQLQTGVDPSSLAVTTDSEAAQSLIDSVETHVSSSTTGTPIPNQQLATAELKEPQIALPQLATGLPPAPEPTLPSATQSAESNSLDSLKLSQNSTATSASPTLPSETALPQLGFAASSIPTLGQGQPTLNPTVQSVSTTGLTTSTSTTIAPTGPSPTPSSQPAAVMPGNNLRMTTKSQSDEEAIIRAYLELTGKNPSATSTDVPMNRYHGNR